MGFFFFLRSSGFWGCGAAARRGGRRRGSLVPAHMSDEPRGAHEPWPPSRTRESPVEWAGRLWCPASRRDIPSHPGRGGRPRSAPVACAERWPLSGPAAGSSKWRTRRPGRAGRVSHPHKGKGPFPLRPLLPVTPRCTGRRLGTFISSWRLGSRP